MRTLKNHIQLGGLDRAEAEILLPLVPKTAGFKYLRAQLKEELATRYEYKVKCTDCPREYTVESLTPITADILKKGGICANCMDDYK